MLNKRGLLFRAQGYAADQIVIAGDSAGGGLTLALATRLRDTHPEEHAAALVLISPYVDLTVSSDSMHSLARRDPMLSRRVLARGGDLYRGELSRDDPRVSPIFADLHHLPPILIQVGSEEVLLMMRCELSRVCEQPMVRLSAKCGQTYGMTFSYFRARSRRPPKQLLKSDVF